MYIILVHITDAMLRDRFDGKQLMITDHHHTQTHVTNNFLINILLHTWKIISNLR